MTAKGVTRLSASATAYLPCRITRMRKGGYPELAARFCEAGFVPWSSTSAAAGPSQGNIDMVGWTHDLAAAFDFLDMLPEVDKEQDMPAGLVGRCGG